MKIWYDPTQEYQFVDNDCPHIYTNSANIRHQLIEGFVQQIRTNIFKQSMSIYIEQCGHERWLVCNPIELGQIAILDSSAALIFEQFRTPTTLSQIMQVVSGWSPQIIEEIIALFYLLGFLQNINSSSPVHKEDEFQTLTAWLHITNACNLNCHYCYVHKTSDNMSNQTAFKAVDAVLRSANKHNFKRVTLKYAGGEASLHIARVIAIHDYASQAAQQYNIKFDAAILSNGVAISQRAIDDFKVRNIELMISLDGIGAYHDNQRPFINGHGSFKYVDRTINRLLANGLVPHISITVSGRNLDGLPSLIQYILERDMPFSLSYYRDNECSTHISDLRFEEQKMIETMRSIFIVIEKSLPKRSLLGCLVDRTNLSASHRYTCGMGQSYLVIDQNGGVAKCHADIKRIITTIDVNDPLQLIRDDRNGIQGLPVEEKEYCRTCEWRYWCAGGCPLQTHRITGRYDIKSPNCNIYKALFPEVLRLEAKRLLNYVSPIDYGDPDRGIR